MEHLQRVWHADRGRLLPPETWSRPIRGFESFIFYTVFFYLSYDQATQVISELKMQI